MNHLSSRATTVYPKKIKQTYQRDNCTFMFTVVQNQRKYNDK